MISIKWGFRKFSVLSIMLCLLVLSAYVPAADAEPKFKGRKRKSADGAEGGEGGEEDEDEGFDTSFCGDVDCYDILGLRMSATKSDIKASYRELSLRWHPDKNVDLPEDEKKAATDHFAKVGLAYKILNTKDSREAYDYFIAHPEQFSRGRAAAYETYAEETDARLVLLIFMAVVSAVQYTSQQYRYKEARRQFANSEKVLKKAMDLMGERGQIPKSKYGKVSAAKVDQDILKATREEVIDESKIGGGYGAPDWKSLFAVQLCMSPVYFFNFVKFNGSWYFRHTIQKEPLNDEEKAYLTRTVLNISEDQWDNHLDDTFKEVALEYEIYDGKEKMNKYREAMMKPTMKKKHIRMKKRL